MRLLLHHNPTYRSGGQSGLELLPVSAVVQGVIQRVTGAGDQVTLLVRVLRHHARIGKWTAFGKRVADLAPGLAEIRGLIEPRIAVVHHVEVDCDVRRPGVEVRRFNLGHDTPDGESGDVLSDIIPGLT